MSEQSDSVQANDMERWYNGRKISQREIIQNEGKGAYLIGISKLEFRVIHVLCTSIHLTMPSPQAQ